MLNFSNSENPGDIAENILIDSVVSKILAARFGNPSSRLDDEQLHEAYDRSLEAMIIGEKLACAEYYKHDPKEKKAVSDEISLIVRGFREDVFREGIIEIAQRRADSLGLDHDTSHLTDEERRDFVNVATAMAELSNTAAMIGKICENLRSTVTGNDIMSVSDHFLGDLYQRRVNAEIASVTKLVDNFSELTTKEALTAELALINDQLLQQDNVLDATNVLRQMVNQAQQEQAAPDGNGHADEVEIKAYVGELMKSTRETEDVGR